MSMSDELMILTIEKMQIELRRAMEDIDLLSLELQRRTSPLPDVSEPASQLTEPVKAKRVIKLKAVKAEDVKKKPTGIVTWNAFVSLIRTEMLKEGEVKNDDVLAKARATKLGDPEAYKSFCANWLLENYTQ